VSTSVIRDLAVAIESAYGSPDAGGVPSESGLPFRYMQFEAASITEAGGASELDEDTQAHAGPFGLPPEVVTSWSGTSRVARQTGDITVDVRVQGYGLGASGMSSSAELPLAALLASGLRRVGTSGASIAPASTSATLATVQLASGGAAAWSGAEGEVVLSLIDGCTVANRITEVDDVADILHFAHEWPRLLTTADRLQRGINLQVAAGAATGTTGASVAIRYNNALGRMVAYGCRLSSVSFSAPNGQLLASITMRAAFIAPSVYSAVQSIFQAPPLRSARCTLRGAALRIGTTVTSEDGAPAAGPLSSPAAELPFQHDGWSVTITNTLESIGTGCGAVGEADCEVAGTTIEMSFESREVANTLIQDMLRRRARCIIQAAAPVDDGGSTLNGWAVCIPAAALSADANVSNGGPLLSQTRNYIGTIYRGDVFPVTNLAAIYLGGTA